MLFSLTCSTSPTSGPIQVEILNKKGETMSRLPVSSVASKKFQIDLKVVWHCECFFVDDDNNNSDHILPFSFLCWCVLVHSFILFFALSSKRGYQNQLSDWRALIQVGVLVQKNG